MFSQAIKKLKYIFGFFFLLPTTLHAQVPETVPSEINTVGDLIAVIGDFIGALIPIAAASALLGFFWGLALYIFKAGNKEATERGKRIMLWGSVALFLISAIGGIISLLAGTLGFPEGGSVTPPSVGTNANG